MTAGNGLLPLNSNAVTLISCPWESSLAKGLAFIDAARNGLVEPWIRHRRTFTREAVCCIVYLPLE